MDFSKNRMLPGLACLALALAACWPTYSLAAHGTRPVPAVDSRGFVDVWQLRRAVAMVEGLQAIDDTDHCFVEGDPDEEPSNRREIARQERAQRACIAATKRRYAAYQKALAAFNRAWRPVMMEAVRRGDHVAEVILRQCETTSALDRSRIESTCDHNQDRRNIAAARLREIGFAPAFDRSGEGGRHERVARDEAQQAVLSAYRQGLLGVGIMNAHHGGNAPKDAAELEQIRRWAVIDAVLQEAPRAFTVSVKGIDFSGGWKTDAFATLRLNRQPLTPGYLNWGRQNYFGGSNSPWTGSHYWRFGPLRVYRQGDRSEVLIAGKDDAEFLTELHEVLATAESNIDRYLQQDPRWGIFLLRRIGHHEWVPEGMASTTGKLNRHWLGQWELTAMFGDWRPTGMPQGKTQATVFRDGDAMRISLHSEDGRASPLLDATGCRLRYSGGMTYLPEGGEHTTSTTQTALGYLPAISHSSQFDPGPLAPFAPLDPRKHYRQVLVQCPEGEWFDTNRVRFLLLARDTMVEVTTVPLRGAPTLVSHYRRIGAPVPVLSSPRGADYADMHEDVMAKELLASVAADAARATSAIDRPHGTSIGELIASLHQTRNERLYYDTNRLPANVKEIEQRSGDVSELTAAYRTDKDDELFRFNLVMILSHKLGHGKLSSSEKEEAAACLVDGLRDGAAWVRTESVWGLRFTGDGRYEAAARALLNDVDSNVRREAHGTADFLAARSRKPVVLP